MRGSKKQLLLTLGIALGLMAYIGAACYSTMEVLHWKESKAMVFVMVSTLILAGLALRHYNSITSKIDHAHMDAEFEKITRITAAKREETIRHRAEELRRDPKRSKYATEVERGVFLTDAQIDYLEDSAARHSCRHLQGVEGLMRASGVRIMPFSDVALMAECVLDEAAMRKLITLDECVSYGEYFDHRDADAWLQCKECRSNICVRHPMLGGSKFPPG